MPKNWNMGLTVYRQSNRSGWRSGWRNGWRNGRRNGWRNGWRRLKMVWAVIEYPLLMCKLAHDCVACNRIHKWIILNLLFLKSNKTLLHFLAAGCYFMLDIKLQISIKALKWCTSRENRRFPGSFSLDFIFNVAFLACSINPWSTYLPSAGVY